MTTYCDVNTCEDCPRYGDDCDGDKRVEHTGWIFNPTDAIDLMFTKPKCSKCGFESSDGGNFCPHCGARMTQHKGGDSE